MRLKMIAALWLSLITLFLVNSSLYAQHKRILVFAKTAGFYHESIAAGLPALQKMGAVHGFGVDTTKNAGAFTSENLKRYAAVVFLNTTGDVLNDVQQTAFENYIRSGGGYVGVHAATDTEYGWPWYGKLAGAYFVNHPEQQLADLLVKNLKTITTAHLPAKWVRKDEWYNFKEINPDIKVLIELDEKSYQGGTNGTFHPIAWYHEYDGGRAFYTGLGHVNESYKDPLFLKHLLGGIQYAMGQRPM